MKCIACNRPLLRYAASTPTRSGMIGWGPKCAARAGIQAHNPARSQAVANEQPGLFDDDVTGKPAHLTLARQKE